MKKIVSFLIFCAFAINSFAQTINEYGNWFFIDGNSSREIYPKTHSAKTAILPNSGYTFSTNQHKIIFSAKEKSKCIKLIELVKEVYPKPKYHSMTYNLSGSTPESLPQSTITKRDYRFNYNLSLASQFMLFDNNKPVDKFKALKFGVEWDYAVININSIPNFFGARKGYFDNVYEGPLFILEEDFSYKKYNGQRALPIGGSDERAAFPRYPSKDVIVSITNRSESFSIAEKYLGKNFGVPSFKLGNEADNHFVYRWFSSSRLNYSGEYTIYGKLKDADLSYDKYNMHTVHNMVILSHNGKLPFTPLTIERFLQIGDDIVNEAMAYANQYFSNESAKKEYVEKLQRNKKFIQSLRSVYASKLQDAAIVSTSYNQVSDFTSGFIFIDSKTRKEAISNTTNDNAEDVTQVINKFFITDPQLGKAFYTHDKDYYKGMTDGEIRSICVVWKDYIRVPDQSDYGKGFQIENSKVIQNRFSDNPDFYLYHFNKKFDWKKLESLLGK